MVQLIILNQIVIFIVEILKKIKEMEQEELYIIMEKNILENGKMIKKKDMEK